MTVFIFIHYVSVNSKADPFPRDIAVNINKVKFCFSVRQLHREFLRAGADVMQTFTFYASDSKLGNRGNTASEKIGVSNDSFKRFL